jgi:hypothetical protein
MSSSMGDETGSAVNDHKGVTEDSSAKSRFAKTSHKST